MLMYVLLPSLSLTMTQYSQACLYLTQGQKRPQYSQAWYQTSYKGRKGAFSDQKPWKAMESSALAQQIKLNFAHALVAKSMAATSKCKWSLISIWYQFDMILIWYQFDINLICYRFDINWADIHLISFERTCVWWSIKHEQNLISLRRWIRCAQITAKIVSIIINQSSIIITFRLHTRGLGAKNSEIQTSNGYHRCTWWGQINDWNRSMSVKYEWNLKHQMVVWSHLVTCSNNWSLGSSAQKNEGCGNLSDVI